MADFFEDTVRPDARLAILRFLEDAPQHTSNLSMVVTLLAQVGIRMTRAQVGAEIDWLELEGLVTCEAPTEHILLVTATLEGIEVATGVGRHPDIKRPAPRA